MSQLFQVYFPKYCFEPQEEFSILFPHADQLPFEFAITAHGIPYFKDLTCQDNVEEFKKWSKMGLKNGIRIIAVNGDRFGKEAPMGLGDPGLIKSGDKLVTEHDIAAKIKHNGHEQIVFTFREDVPSFDESEALGLAYRFDIKQEDFDEGDEKAYNLYDDRKSTQHKPAPSIVSNVSGLSLGSMHGLYKIADDDIKVSSFSEDHDKEYCRLNHPSSYWSPTEENAEGGEVWICFDLKNKKSVNKIQIQGSQAHGLYFLY